MLRQITGSPADMARQILEQLQRIESLLAVSVPPPEQASPEIYGQVVSDWQALIAMSICACIPAAPINCQQIVVFPAETLLIRNESDSYVPVEITNEDVAQWIWVGPKGVLTTAGRIILPLDTARYVLGKGDEIYARCAFATVDVSVIEGSNIFANFVTGGS